MSSDSKAYIGGDPLPRPDISDRGERGEPLDPKPKSKPQPRVRRAELVEPDPVPVRRAELVTPQPQANYRAPDNYSTYGRPGTNDMGPSSPSKTISLGKLPQTSTGKSDFASKFTGKGTVSEKTPAKHTTHTKHTTSAKKTTPALDRRVYSGGLNDPKIEAAKEMAEARKSNQTPSAPTPPKTLKKKTAASNHAYDVKWS